MTVFMAVLLIAVVGALNIVCFFIGAKVGQTVAKGETIKTPTLSPIAIKREREDKRAAEAELDRIEAIMQNIENYDGTGMGQRDVPKR